MAQWFLNACAAAAIWTVRAYFWPFATCRRCSGKRTNPGSGRKRWGACKRCGGTGQRQVLGSRAVHSAVLSIRAERARERKRKERQQ